jgi:hypothetical protein
MHKSGRHSAERRRYGMLHSLATAFARVSHEIPKRLGRGHTEPEGRYRLESHYQYRPLVSISP